MNAVGQLLIVGGISLSAASATFFIKGPPMRISVCDPATLKADEICLAQVVEPVVWIDARPRKEWQANGLPGSILWNLDPSEDTQAFETDAVTRILENPKVVVYCSNEDCGVSRQIAGKADQLALGADIKVLRGGWRALKNAGRVRDSSVSP